MALTTYGYDGTLLEGGWAKLARFLGKVDAIGAAGDWAPTAVGGVDRTVRVAPGSIYRSGVLVVNDANLDVQATTLGAGTRYDTLVLRRDWQTNTSSVVMVAGTATRGLAAGLNANPGTIEDQPLALVKIVAGQQTPAEVIDLRPAFTDDRSEIGTEKTWPAATPPAGYLVEDGSAIDRIKHAKLFALIGTTYGAGDGSTTFNLPNAKGKVIVGLDAAQVEFDTLGESGGTKTHTLTPTEIPAHVHDIGHGHAGSSATSSVAHSHDMSHGHPRSYGATYGGAGGHAHGVPMGDFGGLGGGGTLIRLGYNGGMPNSTAGAGAHDHSNYVDVATQNQGTGSGDAVHNHGVTVTALAGNSGSVGGSGAHNNLQPYTVRNVIIKAL